MRRYPFFMVAFIAIGLSVEAQPPRYSLEYYLAKAFQSSPLLLDKPNQASILNSEKQYLMNVYTHAQTLLSGNYLFVPIIQKDNGTTSFKWNAQSADNYYGYDLGVSSGSLQYGLTWTKPLLGKNVYKAAESQINVQRDMLDNNISLSCHDIERNVTDQYILCMLDKSQILFSDSISSILARQEAFIVKLAGMGQANQSDIQRIHIEQKVNDEMKASGMQSFRSHLMELNTLCCIRDTGTVDLDRTDIIKRTASGESRFLRKYDLDSLYTIASQHVYESKYKPQLNVFTSLGMQTAHYNTLYKNYGLSAGLTFSMLLSDGKLKRIKRQETQSALSSISVYRNNLLTQNNIRCNQCSLAIEDFDRRIRMLGTQLNEYDRLLEMGRKEIQAGQMSVFNYISTLKNVISTRQQKMILEANRQLAVNAYNYYNW